MIEPLAAMYSACQAVVDDQAGEIEMEWWSETGGTEERLTIIVRREVKHYVPAPPK